VPMSGILTLTLQKVSHWGVISMAKAYLHLDKAQHQEDGGHEVEHILTWQPLKGQGDCMGSIAVHAFWMSTEHERLEMEMMAVQVWVLAV
jgi:hypothetical protein